MARSAKLWHLNADGTPSCWQR
jgi:hypothetical protein